MWDFRKYPVSNFSKRLLDGIWHQPVFNLQGGHHGLYAKAKELDRVKVSGRLHGGGSKGRKRALLIGGDACHSGFRESPNPQQGSEWSLTCVDPFQGSTEPASIQDAGSQDSVMFP